MTGKEGERRRLPRSQLHPGYLCQPTLGKAGVPSAGVLHPCVPVGRASLCVFGLWKRVGHVEPPEGTRIGCLANAFVGFLSFFLRFLLFILMRLFFSYFRASYQCSERLLASEI